MPLTRTYNPESYLPIRIIDLAWEGIKTTPTKEHKANICEKLGNGLLYIQENIPRTIKRLCTNPQAITVSIFVAAHLLNCYAFYPEHTVEAVNFLASYIPENSTNVIRFSCWLLGSVTITGLSARAGGRLTKQYIESLTKKK